MMSAERINRLVRLTSRPKGVPEAEHFTVDEVSVPPLQEGQFLVNLLFWSVDPAMRGWVNDAPNYSPPVPIGDVMRSFAVGAVIDSRHAEYAEGEMLYGMFGWQRFAVSDGSDVMRRVGEPDLFERLLRQ